MSWLHGNFLWFGKFRQTYPPLCHLENWSCSNCCSKRDVWRCQFPPKGFERFLFLLLKHFHRCRMFSRSRSPYPLTRDMKYENLWQTQRKRASRESYCSSFKSISSSSCINGGWSWGKIEALLSPTSVLPLCQLVWMICLGVTWMNWSSIWICAHMCKRSSWKGGKLSPHHFL